MVGGHELFEILRTVRKSVYCQPFASMGFILGIQPIMGCKYLEEKLVVVVVVFFTENGLFVS